MSRSSREALAAELESHADRLENAFPLDGPKTYWESEFLDASDPLDAIQWTMWALHELLDGLAKWTATYKNGVAFMPGADDEVAAFVGEAIGLRNTLYSSMELSARHGGPPDVLAPLKASYQLAESISRSLTDIAADAAAVIRQAAEELEQDGRDATRYRITFCLAVSADDTNEIIDYLGELIAAFPFVVDGSA